MFALSVLDLVRTRQGGDASSALDETRDLAIHLENLGFDRIWISEHHNSNAIASAATSIVLTYIGAATRKIRLASGGIMLPNHAPYIIAEQFGTLARLFPNRIDLGLGRAPGTDHTAVQAMRRPIHASDKFPEDVLELQKYFNAPTPGQRLIASPAEGTSVPLTILGSSLFGASMAAQFGLPFAFASHFAPAALLDAMEIYRSRFKPSKQCPKPYAMAGVNVVVADTDEEAERLASSQLKSFADFIQSTDNGPLGPPTENIQNQVSPAALYQAQKMLACSVIGSPETVRKGLQDIIDLTKADELILVSDIYDQKARHSSFERIAQIRVELREAN